MQKATKMQHRHRREVFCSLRSIKQLCSLLKIDKRRLNIFLKQPAYKSFAIPKKTGGERHIEDPNRELKFVLSRLNNYLQSVYLFEKSNAAYGFIVGVSNDDDRRNVLTNARKHVNRHYLLNIDLQDFFHHVSFTKVTEIFRGAPFEFSADLSEVLAGLTTYRGRLPMGSPTSPVLSNLACRRLDEQLTEYCDNMLWVYTRYADDMSFSSNLPFTKEKTRMLRTIIEAEGFVINENKVRFFDKGEPKIVTGLSVSNKVTLPSGYLPELKNEIRRLSDVMRAQNEQGHLQTRWVEQLKQQVRGRLQFAGFILKPYHPEYQSVKDSFYVAIHPPEEEFGAVNWRGFPYNI